MSAKCTLRYNVRKTDIAYSFLFGMQLQNVFIFLPIKSCTYRLLSVIFQNTTRFLHRLYQILYLIIKQTCLFVKDFTMVFSYIFLNMSLVLLKIYFYIQKNEYIHFFQTLFFLSILPIIISFYFFQSNIFIIKSHPIIITSTSV